MTDNTTPDLYKAIKDYDMETHDPEKAKEFLVGAVRVFLKEVMPDLPEDGACVYHAAAFLLLANISEDYGWIAQAGTAYWQRTDEVYDEGRRDFWGYKWSDDHGEGILPDEFHVWLARPETGEVLDLCSGTFPAACKRLNGGEWTAAHPPEYLWTDECPSNAIYAPNKDACERASLVVGQVWQEWGTNFGALGEMRSITDDDFVKEDSDE